MTEAALFDAMIKGFMLAAFIQATSYIILNQDVQNGFSEFSQSVSNFFSDLGSGIANAWNDFTDSVGMWCVTTYETVKIKSINRKLYKKYKYSLKYFSGKSNPRDLEKGMTRNQKGMFQRAIEDFKKSNGMPPNYNLPWVLLTELADEIKESFK